MPENKLTATELTKWTVDYLNLRGHFVWRNNTGRRGVMSFGKTGSHDIIGVHRDGQFMGVEIKVDKDELSEEQVNFHEEVVRRGGISVVVKSQNDVLVKFP